MDTLHRTAKDTLSKVHITGSSARSSKVGLSAQMFNQVQGSALQTPATATLNSNVMQNELLRKSIKES